jgi:hypothetical protein
VEGILWRAATLSTMASIFLFLVSKRCPLVSHLISSGATVFPNMVPPSRDRTAGYPLGYTIPSNRSATAPRTKIPLITYLSRSCRRYHLQLSSTVWLAHTSSSSVHWRSVGFLRVHMRRWNSRGIGLTINTVNAAKHRKFCHMGEWSSEAAYLPK